MDKVNTLKQRKADWDINPVHILLLIILLQLFITLLTDGFALSFDEAVLHFIGRDWLRNDIVPYVTAVDNKSPLFFTIYGLSDKLFGVNYWFPRVVGTLVQSLGLYYVYKIAHHIKGKTAGIFALSFYGLSLLWHSTGSKYPSYTETYEVTFLILSVYYCIIAQSKKHYWLAGIMAGLAVAFRLTAAFCVLAILISCLRKSVANGFFAGLGVLLALVTLITMSCLAGIHMHDLYVYAFADNFNAGSPYDHSFLWKTEQFFEKFFYSEMVLFYPLAIGYIIVQKRTDLFVLWLTAAFGGIVFIGEFTRVHLKELLPALSLMSAFTVSHLIDEYRLPFNALFFIIWIVFLPKLTEPLVNVKKVLLNRYDQPAKWCIAPYPRPDEGTLKKLGWWVRDHTNNNEKVFVAGFGAQVQVYSERQSVYFNEMQTPLAKAKLYADITKNEPAMILIPMFAEYEQYMRPDIRDYMSKLVAKDYVAEGCMYNYAVYRLKPKSK